MPRILVSASFPETLLARQTPNSSGRWEEFEFVFEASDQPVDGWVVIDDLRQPTEQLCAPDNTLFITGEPESVRRYRSRFTSQFASVWTSHTKIQHARKHYCNEAQHWHYAMQSNSVHGCPLDLDGLQSLQQPTKERPISVICSNKSVTPDHRQRLEFVETLRRVFGDAVDVFGRGTRPIADKAEAIWPYKYHVVLENDHSDLFMTEKIADAFLGWSYPIYFGGSEAYHRFPAGSFTALDIYQPESAIAIIRNVLAGQTYESSLEQITEARRRVLQENNLMAMLADYFREHLRPQRPTPITLYPKNNRASLVLRQVGRAVARPFQPKAA